ncbi:MAG TPA: hypothetical protein VFW22_16395 [Pseudolabrys sp.]|nr:hypothetical protein [Pseudolabrys sp.]
MSEDKPHGGLQIGDIVTRIGTDRMRVTHLYEGCDEIVVEDLPDPEGKEEFHPGIFYDLHYWDVQLIERPDEPAQV